MSHNLTDASETDASLGGGGYSTVFKNRQFMSLWIAQVCCQFADRAVFVLFVAILTAQELTNPRLAGHGAAQVTSWLYVAFTIPAIVLSPIAGVYVDRWSHRVVMISSNILRAACVALIVLPAVSNSIVVDFGLAFLISIGSQFFGPAETSSIPRLVKKNELYAANSLFFTTMMIALGFGFAIGEPIITHIGMKAAPLFVSGLFIAAALLLLGISDNKPKQVSREPWWEELRFGLAYIATNSQVFKAIFKITVLFSTIITLNVIAVGLTQQVLHLASFKFGYIVAAAGVGMAVGNFWVGHYGSEMRPNLLVFSGFTGLGLFMSLLGALGVVQSEIPWTPAQLATLQNSLLPAALMLAALVGGSCAMVAVPTQAALQAVVPEELRGKVFGAQNTAMSAASTIPVVLAGMLIDNLPGGVSSTLFLIGVPTLIIGAYHLVRTFQGKDKPVDDDDD